MLFEAFQMQNQNMQSLITSQSGEEDRKILSFLKSGLKEILWAFSNLAAGPPFILDSVLS